MKISRLLNICIRLYPFSYVEVFFTLNLRKSSTPFLLDATMLLYFASAPGFNHEFQKLRNPVTL